MGRRLTNHQLGGRKAAQTIRERYGYDENGKSLHHKRAGAIGGKHGTGPRQGNFGYLKVHDPEKLKAISTEGAARSNLAQGKGQKSTDGTV